MPEHRPSKVRRVPSAQEVAQSPRAHEVEVDELVEIVEAVLYLESAAFVTGETLHIAGGAHAGHW